MADEPLFLSTWLKKWRNTQFKKTSLNDMHSMQIMIRIAVVLTSLEKYGAVTL